MSDNLQKDDFRNMLPEGEREYYDKLSESDKELLEKEYPRVYLKDGALVSIPEDIYWQAKTVYWEARGTDEDTKEAIAWAIKNRRDAGRYGTTYRDHFSSKAKIMDDNLLRGELSKNDQERAAWEESVKYAIESNILIPTADPTHGATHFLTPKGMKRFPSWTKTLPEIDVKTVEDEIFRFWIEE